MIRDAELQAGSRATDRQTVLLIEDEATLLAAGGRDNHALACRACRPDRVSQVLLYLSSP